MIRKTTGSIADYEVLSVKDSILFWEKVIYLSASKGICGRSAFFSSSVPETGYMHSMGYTNSQLDSPCHRYVPIHLPLGEGGREMYHIGLRRTSLIPNQRQYNVPGESLFIELSRKLAQVHLLVPTFLK